MIPKILSVVVGDLLPSLCEVWIEQQTTVVDLEKRFHHNKNKGKKHAEE